MSVTWTWRLDLASGEQADLDVPGFASQSDAESWLGEVWRDLVEAGATQATLLEDDHVAYGPMSLLAE
jgi:hypothetical protein